jgi:hypothetical protein
MGPPQQLPQTQPLVHHPRLRVFRLPSVAGGWAKKTKDYKNRVVISIQQNNSITSQLDRYLPGEVSGAGFAFLHFPTPPGDQRRVVGQLHG